jgi:hypothetical protein
VLARSRPELEKCYCVGSNRCCFSEC